MSRHPTPLLAAGLAAAALGACSKTPARVSEPAPTGQLASPLTASAGPATLLKDTNAAGYGSSVGAVVVSGGHVYFVASDGVNGRVLLQTDAAGAAPTVVAVLDPSLDPEGGDGELVDANGTLFFTARDPDLGFQLFATDGTAAGTRRLTNLGRPGQLTNVNGTLFFAATTRGHENQGPELWKSDGTAAGTVRVKPLVSADGAGPQSLTNVNGTLYFGIDDGVHGYEPWKSDGTDAGTVLLKDIAPGAAGSWAGGFYPFKGSFVFSADDGTHGMELWKSDGTEAGTVLLGDLDPADASYPSQFTAVGDALFFSAATGGVAGIYRTDGTTAGTGLVYAGEADGLIPIGLVDVNGKLVFSGQDPEHGRELWTSDGTAAGTHVIVDLFPGTANGAAVSSVVVGGKLYFRGNTAAAGTELWTTDGTEAGTVLVKDLLPGTDSSSPQVLAAVGDRVLFLVDDRVHGSEPWITDGTDAGTRLFLDVNGGTDSAALSGIIPVGNGALFTAWSRATDRALWKTDGTSAGTALVKTNPARGGFDMRNAAAFDGGLLFSAPDAALGREVWKTDGTAAGTMVVKDIAPGVADSNPGGFTVVNGVALFQANDGVHGRELWKTDGTEAGTALLADLHPGGATSNSSPTSFTVVGNRVYFSATDGTTVGLYFSDGTAQGTQRADTGLTDIYAYGPVRAFGGKLLLTVNTSAAVLTYLTDGTPAGTVKIADFAIGNGIEAGGKLYFSHDGGGGTGEEPWVSDGTAAGTKLLKDLDPNGPSRPSDFVAVNGNVFFVAYTTTSGRELWKTDGTAQGTALVKEIAPGTGSSAPAEMTAVDGLLVFSASDAEHGREVWRSDGTAQGTTRLTEIAPGANDANPSSFLRLGDVIVFAANDRLHGQEPWVMPVSALTTPTVTCPADMTVEATSTAGAPATFAATATAPSGAAPVLTYSSAPASAFPLGDTTVTATATDGGASVSCTFVVHVVDTTAPTFTRADETAEATSAQGAAVTFTATATDLADGAIPATCTPASGSTFALGETPVSCTASDRAGHGASGSFKVIVRDTTAPALTCPGDKNVTAADDTGAKVELPAAAAKDAVSASPKVVSAPASGQFAVGTTPVTVTATDDAGNTSTCSYKVVVAPKPGLFGCAAASPGDLGVVALALSGLLARRRRRTQA